jgi:hypothetical protein
MSSSTKVVWLGYASIALAFIWGVGIVPAVMARHIARSSVGTTPREVSDLRGGRLLATIGLGLNILVIAMVIWIQISTRVL